MLIANGAVFTQEYYQSLPAGDQFTKGGPIINGQRVRVRGGHKRIRINSTLCKRIPEPGDIHRVPISQEEGDNFVCICIQPALDGPQKRLEGPRIF